MAKPRRKLTAARRRARRERKEKYQIIFVNGKQKRVLRPPTIDGMPVEEFLARNADPVWLMQNGMWEALARHEATRAPTDPRCPPHPDGR